MKRWMSRVDPFGCLQSVSDDAEALKPRVAQLAKGKRSVTTDRGET